MSDNKALVKVIVNHIFLNVIVYFITVNNLILFCIENMQKTFFDGSGGLSVCSVCPWWSNNLSIRYHPITDEFASHHRLPKLICFSIYFNTFKLIY